MRFKKASLTDILTYVLIFTLFSAFIFSFIFNNIAQDKRSMMVDKLNKEAMTLQANLEGYSNTYEYCFMYKNGKKMTPGEVQDHKNKAIEETKQSIKDYFNDERNSSQMKLESVNIEILDGPSVRDTASIKITVNYNASFRSPYTEEGEGSANSAGRHSIKMKDTATRVIENPVRQKNL